MAEQVTHTAAPENLVEAIICAQADLSDCEVPPHFVDFAEEFAARLEAYGVTFGAAPLAGKESPDE